VAQERPRVVIVGGGFGGLTAARALRRAPVEVTVIDRRNFHLFQPLLYQVATGALSPANVAAPLRGILARQRNARVLLGEVVGLDLEKRRVLLSGGSRGDEAVPYDWLVVAAGSRFHYFGNDEWERVAPGLKTVEDATVIRARVLAAFEAAAREDDPDRVRQHLTFVVVGAGPTGVELAGAIAELARDTLRRELPVLGPWAAQIILIETSDDVLPTFPKPLRDRACQALERLDVTVRTATMVTAIDQEGVEVRNPDGETERIPSRVVLWAAGVSAEPLAERLARAAGVEVDRGGRLPVDAELALAGRPEVMAIGDMALARGPDGEPLPGLAPVAIQQGKYVAERIARLAEGRTSEPFRYRSPGLMATIGRGHAVADLGWIRLWGLIGWVAWLAVHLMQITTFQNRVLVLLQWAFAYITRNRPARLITDPPERHDTDG
jgi:NADH:ubiquinone reductase (H+-translocating)